MTGQDAVRAAQAFHERTSTGSLGWRHPRPVQRRRASRSSSSARARSPRPSSPSTPTGWPSASSMGDVVTSSRRPRSSLTRLARSREEDPQEQLRLRGFYGTGPANQEDGQRQGSPRHGAGHGQGPSGVDIDDDAFAHRGDHPVDDPDERQHPELNGSRKTRIARAAAPRSRRSTSCSSSSAR